MAWKVREIYYYVLVYIGPYRFLQKFKLYAQEQFEGTDFFLIFNILFLTLLFVTFKNLFLIEG